MIKLLGRKSGKSQLVHEWILNYLTKYPNAKIIIPRNYGKTHLLASSYQGESARLLIENEFGSIPKRSAPVGR